LPHTLDSPVIMDVIRKIFQSARSQAPEIFQDQVLEHVKRLIPFDSCKWVTGTIIGDQATAHSGCFQNFPDQGKEYYAKYQQQDAILKKLVATRDQVRTYDRYEVTPREIFIKQPFYKYCRKNGIEHLISTIVPEPVSNLFTIVSFGRKDFGQPFTTVEKQIKTIITPILAEARSHNIFINLLQIERAENTSAAIFDTKGILREAEPAFSGLILEEWPDWQGPMLACIPEILMNAQQPYVYQGKKINIHISYLHDLVLLQASEKSVLEVLTSAEKKVASLLLQGRADKEIASLLKVSPKTVGHHLQHIYSKTGTPNRKRFMARFSKTAHARKFPSPQTGTDRSRL